MLKLEKKQIKMVSLTVAILFVLGIAGLAVSSTTGISNTVSAASSSNIGIVDFQMLIYQHPDMAKAEETMQAEVKAAQQDFEAKAANMSDKEKQEYYMQVQQRLNLKQQELKGPILDKINSAVKGVADAKGLSVVLDKNDVVYGGQNITDEVLKKLGK